LVSLLLSLVLASQQTPAVTYSAAQLDCARFVETGESKILTEAGGRTRRQTSTRRGTWQFRSTPSGQELALEGWFDSLSITRRSEETAITPDTDGLLGGRYRGTLSRTGHYTPLVHPFVPDEVAEVAGMTEALNDVFPPLADRSLREGETWTDASGLTIRRQPDSVSSGTRLHRFELMKEEKIQTAASAADTVPLEVQQRSEETGRFVWHPQAGLLRRERTIVVETTVPPSRTVRQAVRSKVEQQITLARLLPPSGCRLSGGR
jgi:hypothetical protein